MTKAEIETNELSVRAMGGTELMLERIYSTLDPELLDKFQIIPSRVRELNPNKVRILYCHDLPEDPESKHLENGGWRNFHKIVFVSNWQMQQYINHHKIPWERCVVMQNAIRPIPNHEKSKNEIRLGYWSTPHRGLEILVPVFLKLLEKYPDLKLDVFSSFQLYGWPDRDKAYENLFDICKEHPSITYHASVDNKTLRSKLPDIHIMAYPSIWLETSCLCLMEAMSAKCLPVHSNLGALYETSANWTYMYQYHEDPNKHAGLFYNILDQTIANYWDAELQARIESMKTYSDIFYNWEYRAKQWEGLLTALKDEPTKIEEEKKVFHYRVQ
jgi:glycosyltransferase involved in cell wall biosynthesis